jgi:putative peptidoglycan lipid II flippase
MQVDRPAVSSTEKHGVVFSAFLFAGGTLLSRVLGLIRDMMTARYFPAEIRDAFLVAFRLPNVFRRLFGEGALSVSFIPVFLDILTGSQARYLGASEAEERARRMVASVFSVGLGVTITLSLLGIVFMERILGFLITGEAYLSVPGKFLLTVKLARIMFGFLVLVSTYAFFMAVLNSLKKFALSALAPCLFNISLIFAAMISPRVAAPAEVLAWAVIVGGVLQAGILIPAVIRTGFVPRLTWRMESQDAWRVFKAFIPSALSIGVMQISTLVSVHFASYLAQGAHSYLYLADRLLELPLSLFVVSIGSALLPTLAAQWASGDRDGMGETVNHYMRLIVFISLPAAVGLFVLAQPICEILFLGREFKYQDAVATAQVIQVYSLGIVVMAGVRILAQGFYAIRNTWFPAVAAGTSVCSHIFFAWALTKEFGLVGLASASVGGAVVNLLMLAAAYNSWVGSLQLKLLAKSFAKFVVCAAAMVAALQVYPSIQMILGGGTIRRSLVLAFAIVLGAGVYFLGAHVLRVSEYRETMAAILERVRQKWPPRPAP